MTSFHEILFPLDVALKSAGGPERRTDIVSFGSGREARNARWAQSRRRFDAGYGVKTLDALRAVIAFFEERRGRLYGFRWRDRLDSCSAATGNVVSPLDQVIGIGDGTTSTFQLIKTYGGAFAPYARAIAKPVNGSVRVAVADSEIAAGSAFACDATTGVVTFLPEHTPPPGAAVTAGFSFDVPVRFDTDYLEVDLATFAAGAIRKFRWWRSAREKHSLRASGKTRFRRDHSGALLDCDAARRRRARLYRSRLRSDDRQRRLPRRHRIHRVGSHQPLRSRGRWRRDIGCILGRYSERTDLAAGRYDAAEVATWLVDWSDVSLKILVARGTIGEVRREGSAFTAELRGLADALTQDSGRLFRARCGVDLGDGKCGVDLTSSTFRSSGTVTAIEGTSIVAVSGLSGFAGGWFTAGRLNWTGGANAGLAIEVKQHRVVAGEALISLWQAMAEPIAIGDSFVITAGCDKSFATCRDRFANTDNFRGFPQIPGNDFVVSYPLPGSPDNGNGSKAL